MKLWLYVYTHPCETKSNEISAAQQRRVASSQGAPGLYQCPDGELVRRIDGTSISQIPVGRGQARNGLPRFDVWRYESSLDGRPGGKHRSDSRGGPLGRGVDRVEQGVKVVVECSRSVRVDVHLVRLAYLDARDISSGAPYRLTVFAHAEESYE